MLVVIMTTLYPLAFSFANSFRDWNLTRSATPGEFVGLRNYARILTDAGFANTVVITLEYTLLSVGITIVIGLAMALLLQKPGWVPTVIKTILIFPYAMAPIIKGYTWRFMVEPEYGVLDNLIDILVPAVADINWLAQPFWALFTIATSEIWGWAPIIALMFVGALGAIPPSILEAAKVDGANNLQVFWYVTLPMLRPILFIITLLKTIFSLRIFDQVVAMTGGGPGRATQTLNFYVYHVAFRTLDMGYASAVGYVLVIALAILSFFYVKALLGREEE
jgi:multiple sugar transport system permease protein